MITGARFAESRTLPSPSVATIESAIAVAKPSTAMSPPRPPFIADARALGVSMVVARALVDAATRSGIAAEEVLRAARLAPERLDAPEARLPLVEMGRLCDVALELTGDPALGLHWAERSSERTFVPISHLVAHASSLRHGLELLARYFGLLSDRAAYQVFELDDALVVRSFPFTGEPTRIRTLSSEMLIGGLLRLVRTFDARARPECVCFEYPAPPHHDEYARFFEGAALFDQPFTGLVFDRAVLDTSSPQKDDDVRAALEGLAEQRLLRIAARTPYAQRVRDTLVKEGSARRTEMPVVARALGLSVRTLRRRLTEEKSSYDVIVDEALAIVAKRLLDQRRTIQEVAYEMGFSDTSTFHRAFKRWTGTTPSRYRDPARK